MLPTFSTGWLDALHGVGNEIQLAYALEFGILVTETVQHGKPELLAVAFDSKARQAVVSRYEITEFRYTLASHIRHNLTILIEWRDPNPGEYYEMPKPAFAAVGHTRWPVEVPANGDASFSVRIQQVYQSHEDVNKWQMNFIQQANPPIAAIDATLHQERLTAPRNKRVYQVCLMDLPNGTFIAFDDAAYLVWEKSQLRWPAGYVEIEPKPGDTVVNVLTPASVVKTLAAGYMPETHPLSTNGGVDEHDYH